MCAATLEEPKTESMSSATPGAAARAGERTIATNWPTISATWRGQLLGNIYLIRAGSGVLPLNLSLGKLLAFASIPFVLPLIFLPLGAEIATGVLLGLGNWLRPLRGPLHGLARLNDRLAEAVVGLPRKYRLTTQRVLVERAILGMPERSVSLDRFDNIAIDVRPGQAWYPAGDLVFKQKGVETFRLPGVRRPETFRQTCLKAHLSHIGVADARKRGLAV